MAAEPGPRVVIRVPVRPLLLFVLLTPLVPRPTVTGRLALLAPASMVLLIAAFTLGVAVVATIGRNESIVIGRMLFVLIVPTMLYGLRILAEAEWSEGGYFAAKLAMSLGSLVILTWLYASEVSVEQLYRALLVGYLLLAALMLYVGVTGQGVFEPARPARSYGFHIPFFKAAGIPRSYGELAIFSTAVLAYLLVYRRRMRRPLWAFAMVAWCLTELIAQSRTGFISAAVVLLGFIGLRVLARRTAAFLMIIGVLSIPIAAQWLYPSLQAEQYVSDVIGQSTFQANVDLRVNMYGMALSWLTHPSTSLFFWGIDRSQWLAGTTANLGTPVVLHNYFLSELMFFGLAAGMLSILGLLLLPLWRLASSGLVDRQEEVVFLATIGMVTSLQFYEGFFSLILMWQLAALWYVAYGRARPGRRVAPLEAPVALQSTQARSRD